jgi:excisionase family DNA binding protein
MGGASTAKPAGTLMDIEAVATRLGISVRYVRRLVAERRIPYVKFGHLLRFDPGDIEAWIEKAKVDALWPPTPGRWA